MQSAVSHVISYRHLTRLVASSCELQHPPNRSLFLACHYTKATVPYNSISPLETIVQQQNTQRAYNTTMSEATPRISAPYLEQFSHQTVRILGKVTQIRGEQASIDAGGNINVHLNRVSHIPFFRPRFFAYDYTFPKPPPTRFHT